MRESLTVWKGLERRVSSYEQNGKKSAFGSRLPCLTGSFGMTARAEELKDLNPYRQQTVTAMDEYGNITEIGDSDGVIEGGETSGDRELQSSTSLIVNFNTKSNEVTNFTEDGTGEAGYTNGDYGADAAYLGSSNGKVKFMMSGVVGWVDASGSTGGRRIPGSGGQRISCGERPADPRGGARHDYTRIPDKAGQRGRAGLSEGKCEILQL